MFGYVRAYKPELKIAEYDTYKSIYCTLCKTLKKDYGIFAPLILSYDFTFLAMLRLGVGNNKVSYEKKRCPYNPTKRCMKACADGDELSYTAACLILMFYYKIKDNIADKGFFGKLLPIIILPLFSHYRKKAMKKHKQLDDYFALCMIEQAELEKQDCMSIDKACDPTAKMLKFAFSREIDDKNTYRILKSVGYNAGKWVYLMDAFDDLEKDVKSNNYNPIINKYNLNSSSDLEEALSNTKALINNCNVALANDFELLEFKRFKPILSNIIYQGLPDVLNTIKSKEN